LLKSDHSLARHTSIIPQRDIDFPVGINTFVRKDHQDLNRLDGGNYMKLFYQNDASETRGREGDFVQQCTGLATNGIELDLKGNPIGSAENLRLLCINKLLDEAKKQRE